MAIFRGMEHEPQEDLHSSKGMHERSANRKLSVGSPRETICFG
jgi:hypothetical protein